VKSTVVMTAVLAASALSGIPCANAADAVSVDVPVQGRENVSYAYADVLRADPIYETVPSTGRNCSVAASDATVTVHGRDEQMPVDATDETDVLEDDEEDIGSDALPVAALAAQTATTAAPPEACATAQRRIAGYDVEYRYKGTLFMSRMDYDPGNKLRIRITVAPAD